MAKIEYKTKGRVAFIALNRPEVMNAIDLDMVYALDSLWREFESDKGIWVGILTGAGDNFCSGYDVKQLNSSQTHKNSYAWNKSSMFGENKCGPDGHNVTKPLIAALDGHVNGVGVWLALQTDLRIATHKTTFGLGEARFNFPVEFSAFIANYIPRAIATEMLFSLRSFNAQRLFELGIVNQIVSQDQLLITAEKVADELIKRGPLCLQAMKALLNYDPNYQDKLRLSADKIVPVVNSEDTKIALKAFMEKRKPEWQLK